MTEFTFYGCSLPSINQNHSGIELLDLIEWRLEEIRPFTQKDRLDQLLQWNRAKPYTKLHCDHQLFAAYTACASQFAPHLHPSQHPHRCHPLIVSVSHLQKSSPFLHCMNSRSLLSTARHPPRPDLFVPNDSRTLRRSLSWTD